MAHKSAKITVFSALNGHNEWQCVAFCLKSARITFQRMINTLLSDIVDNGVQAYFDDLLVCGRDVAIYLIYLANLKAIFLKLKHSDHKAKLTKCEFLKSKICLPDYKVNGATIYTMDDRTSAIKLFPRLKSVQNVISLGCVITTGLL